MKKVVLMLMLLCMLPFQGAYAAATNMTLSIICDRTTQKLEISGTVSENRENQVFLQIVPKGETTVTEQMLNDGSALLLSSDANVQGTYHLTVALPDVFPGGEYEVQAICDGVSAKGEFRYISMDSLQEIAAKLTAPLTAQKVDEVLAPQLEQFLIDEETYAASREFICEVVAARRPSQGYTADGLLDVLYGAIAAAEIKAHMPIEEVFESWLYDMLDYTEDFESLSAAAKEELLSALEEADYTEADFYDIYVELAGLAVIHTAGDFTVIRDYILKNSERLGVDLDDYTALSGYRQDLIMQDVFAERQTISSLSQIPSIFDEAVDNQTSSVNTGNTGGSGGGGGGGSRPSSSSSGTSVVFDPVPMVDIVQGKIDTKYFSDLGGHWAAEYVNALAERNIVSGYGDGTFQPDNKVSRAEFAKMVCQVFGFEESNTQPQFVDVSEQDWYAAYIEAMAERELLLGEEDGRVRPNDTITREDAATIINRALSYTGTVLVGSAQFSDNDQISPYALEAVGALAQNGIIRGYDQQFLPKDALTRAEAVTLIYHILSYTTV